MPFKCTCTHVWPTCGERVSNLLKTAVSVLASTVRLRVSFMEPLITVSVTLRCSLAASSSATASALPSRLAGEAGGAPSSPDHPSHSAGEGGPCDHVS